MAKTKNPLLSLDAHGSFGRVLTYSHRKSGKQVRKYTKPLVVASAKQRGQRRLTEFLVAQWQNMSAGDKATWEANARLSGPHITGYHYFLREAQRDLYTHTGLCGYWHCNEIVDGEVLDLSGNDFHGALGPSYPANAPVPIDSYKTKFSKGLLYDGVDEFVNCGNDAKLSPPQITITGWIKSLEDAVQGIVSKRKSYGVNDEYNIFYLSTTKELQARIGGKAAAGKFAKISAVPIIGVWYNFAMTFDATTIKLYLNAVKGTDGVPGVGIVNQGNNVMLGMLQPSVNEFYGTIDEVCIYNRVLSATEIATRYKFAMREVD